MSEATRQAWLDAWKNLESARAAFGEAQDATSKIAALADMLGLAHAFESAVSAYGNALSIRARIATNRKLRDKLAALREEVRAAEARTQQLEAMALAGEEPKP
jgi:hypothetical protein